MRAARQDWTSHDVRKLKAMAGKHSLDEIAVELGRGPSAVKAKAYELRVSLKVQQILGPVIRPGLTNMGQSGGDRDHRTKPCGRG
jgi:hypothetical protein